MKKTMKTTMPDIYYFFSEVLKYTPRDEQRHLADAVNNRALYSHACMQRGKGKTSILAACALYLSWHTKGGTVLFTAPTLRQSRHLFLYEIRSLVEKASPEMKKAVSFTPNEWKIEREGTVHGTGKLFSADLFSSLDIKNNLKDTDVFICVDESHALSFRARAYLNKMGADSARVKILCT